MSDNNDDNFDVRPTGLRDVCPTGLRDVDDQTVNDLVDFSLAMQQELPKIRKRIETLEVVLGLAVFFILCTIAW